MEINLPIHYRFNGQTIEQVELQPINGAAEKIFAKKTQEKPYTWLANIVSASCFKIGEEEVSQKVRTDFIKSGSVSVPPIVKAMPMHVANILVVEIHRKLWESKILQQEIMCKYCAKQGLRMDVDLDRICFSEQEEERIMESEQLFETATVTLPMPYVFKSKKKLNGDLAHPELHGTSYDSVTFRAATLGDFMKHERIASDLVSFARAIQMDCLIELADSSTGMILDKSVIVLKKEAFFDDLVLPQLKAMREGLEKMAPNLKFFYEDTCPCEKEMTIPITVEAGSFFSS